MNASELEGAELDAAVARAEGLEPVDVQGEIGTRHGPRGDLYPYWPSKQWALGGTIIERERLTVCSPHADAPPGRFWQACTHQGHFMEWGPTPLIAAMRAYVASKGKP